MKFLVSRLRDLGSEEKTKDFDPKALLGELPSFIDFHMPIHVEGKAKLVGEEVLFSGFGSTRYRLTCGRCLEDVDKSFNVRILQSFAIEGAEIDVNSEIRDAIFTDLPLSAICTKSCEGLCATCGENKNITNCNCESLKVSNNWKALNQFDSK
ncbi:MAG: YceD family protein [Elusimicrobiota bacterium]